MNRRSSAVEVCDIIIDQATNRFQSTKHLSVPLLFLPQNFEAFSKKFPENELTIATEAFPEINKPKLKTELEVMYSRTDLRNASGASSLLQLFIQNGLTRAFSESVKLLKIIVTLPMTTVENERCFSTLKRIKTFLKNNNKMSQDRLNALATLSISKKLIQSIPEFNRLVIDEFSELKQRQMDFKYL
ncbi:hypothetical protein ILUMI_00447 [Ignelater luminosus]|uniref:HAT C-terminal dimerisation domain-containing protein n=1 Tax=Ignelater luminosus TaxID=2038154 RepID=A0A8K0DKE6_IGNLU|nr:hypothetical protein ILUMI_00447 [Ignelater luminosus]